MKTLATLLLAICTSFGSGIVTEEEISNYHDTYLSAEAAEACYVYGEEYDICPEFIMAIVERESSGNPNAENGNHIGLMQISTKWHADRIEELGGYSLYDEDFNIHVGTDYLAELIGKYGEDKLSYILDVYNGNSKAKSNYENDILSTYASDVLSRTRELQLLHMYKEVKKNER